MVQDRRIEQQQQQKESRRNNHEVNSRHPVTICHHPDHLLVICSPISVQPLYDWLCYHLQHVWQTGLNPLLHLHFHLLRSCVLLLLLCLCEAENLRVQLVAIAVKLDIIHPVVYSELCYLVCGLHHPSNSFG